MGDIKEIEKEIEEINENDEGVHNCPQIVIPPMMLS